MNAAFNKLPKDIIELFNKYGGSITFTDNNLGTNDDGYEIIGTYASSDNKITVNTKYQDDIERVILHEFGHFIYEKTVHLYDDDIIIKFQKETNSDNVLDMNETFAEGYACWKIYTNERTDSSIEPFIYKKAEKLCKEINESIGDKWS